MSEATLGSVMFDDRRTVLVLADTRSGMQRGFRSAELSGCRVAGSEDIGRGPERLERQASLDAVFLNVEHRGGELDHILARLQRAAEEGAFGSVVSAPSALIDVVSAAAWHPRIQLLFEADETEEAVALRLASARPHHRLHDIGSEQGAPRLQQISEEVRRIASALERISAEEGRNDQAPERGEDPGKPIDAGAVRAIIRARRLRDQFFGSDLFADPAWDILLDLYAAQLENQRVAVSSLCIAAAVPATTALRWIKTLTDMGLLVRAADPQDGRRVYIELAAPTFEGMQAYLRAAHRISPLNL